MADWIAGDIRKASIDERDTAREAWQRYSHPSSDHLTLVNCWLWWKRYRSGKSEGHDAAFALQHFLNRKKCMEVDRCLDDLIKKFGKCILKGVRFTANQQDVHVNRPRRKIW
jgi:hypothetical protein